VPTFLRVKRYEKRHPQPLTMEVLCSFETLGKDNRARQRPISGRLSKGLLEYDYEYCCVLSCDYAYRYVTWHGYEYCGILGCDCTQFARSAPSSHPFLLSAPSRLTSQQDWTQRRCHFFLRPKLHHVSECISLQSVTTSPSQLQDIQYSPCSHSPRRSRNLRTPTSAPTDVRCCLLSHSSRV
jgi:hypothetical protein